MMRRTELGANTKVFFRVMSHPVKWARTVTANTHKMETSPHWFELRSGSKARQEGNSSWIHVDKHLIKCVTWQGKKGENSERDHTQLSENVIHSDDIDQDLLRYVRSPKHHKAKLDTNEQKQINLCARTTIVPRHASLHFISSLTQGVPDWMWAFEAPITQAGGQTLLFSRSSGWGTRDVTKAPQSFYCIVNLLGCGTVRTRLNWTWIIQFKQFV